MNVSPVPPPCFEQDFPLEEATGRGRVKLVFLSPLSQLFPLPMHWAAVLVQKHSPKPDVWRWPPLSCRGPAEGTASAETSHFQGEAGMDHLGGKIYKQTKGTWMTMAKWMNKFMIYAKVLTWDSHGNHLFWSVMLIRRPICYESANANIEPYSVLTSGPTGCSKECLRAK